MSAADLRGAGGVGAVPRDLRIVTPAGWYDLELDPVLRKTRHARLVRRRLGREPELARLREEVLEQLETVTARAEVQGAVFASMFSQVMEGKAVAATLFAFLRPAMVGDDLRATLEESAEALRGGDENDDDGPALEVDVVELPAGLALRHRRRVVAPVSDRMVECDNVSYVLPVPAVRRTLFLEFSTPTLPVADAMTELFDAMARTVRWVW